MNQRFKTISRIGVALGSSVLLAAAFGFVQTRMTVESRDGRRATRKINVGDNGRYNVQVRVRLLRTLSDAPCIQGRTWGYSQSQIWVDRGCRGEFEILTDRNYDGRWDDERRKGKNGGRWGRGKGGANHGQTGRPWDKRDNRYMREVRVESKDDRRAYLRIDTSGGVRLIRRLSDSPCIEGRTWGYDRNGIWVTRGCRAVFGVNSRRGW